MNIGSQNRVKMDSCATELRIKTSTDPLKYMLYLGAHESCNKCIYDNFYVKYQPEIINVENELLNLTRPLSDCPQYKYNPQCKKSGLCTSTFDKSVPVVLAPEVCPIVYNNIPRQTHPGYRIPNQNPCRI